PQQLIELCKEKNCDLLITDIQKTKKQEFDVIKELISLHQNTEIILYTDSQKFEHAKEAIELGISAYILKKSEKETLSGEISKAIKNIQHKNRELNESILKNILNTGHVKYIRHLKITGLENGFFCVAISGKNCTKKLSRMLKNTPFYFLEEEPNFVLCCLPSFKKEEVFTWDFDWIKVIGISSTDQNLSQLRLVKNQAYAAMFQIFFHPIKPKQQKIFVFKNDMFISDFSDFDTAYERFIGRLEFLSTNEITAGINSLFNFSSISEKKRGTVFYYLYNKITTNLFSRFPGHVDCDDYLYSKGIAIENIWETENLSEWKALICDYMIYLSTLLQKHTANYPFIADAIDYIKSHFTGTLNMAMVANHVSVNYTYFSEKFKEHTGINFNDYLKRVRIEEACRLLTDGFYKVYEVSTRCGFSDVKYFMRSFKELVGVTPGEYRRSRNKNI
ncbi:MAG: helix-turn-helix domain-containing protein, partial [Spirochaetaceae bacterium]|nr:helix-turn-helix domain-containing protein [Spirochaetaceae bacterium]